MTQSKDDYTITLDSGETIDLSNILDATGDITINLDNTMGATTTYWAGDSVTDVVYNGSNAGTFTISSDDTIDISSLSWDFGNKINPDEVSKMCEHYPGLEKVWRNFKSVYDMCKQDYEGKKKAGEIDDDELPF